MLELSHSMTSADQATFAWSSRHIVCIPSAAGREQCAALQRGRHPSTTQYMTSL
jgi:hypothetical protein